MKFVSWNIPGLFVLLLFVAMIFTFILTGPGSGRDE